MKFIVAILFLSASALAVENLPTALEIAGDFQKTYDLYNGEATKFVDKLAGVLDQRVSTYVAAHQNLITHFGNVRLVPGVILDAKSEEILGRITARVTNMILNYPKVLDRNIFSNELKKHMDKLKNGYLIQAEDLIKELGKYVTENPSIGKCWQENREEIFKVVQNGFIAARDAALTTVKNANSTLNTNEMLIDALIVADKSFVEICKSLGKDQVNGCIASYINVSDLTFPASSSIWEQTTNSTVSVNLQVAESMIQSATQIAAIQITQTVFKIQRCVTEILSKPKA